MDTFKKLDKDIALGEENLKKEEENRVLAEANQKTANKTLTWTIVGTIAGIVTAIFLFSLQLWLAKINESTSLASHAGLLYIELEQNKKDVQGMDSKCKEWSRGEKLDEFYYFEYDKTAFDMLKTSGNMRLIEDSSLRTKITDIYRDLEIRKRDMERKMDIKWDFYVKYITSKQDSNDFKSTINQIINYENMEKHFSQLNDTITQVLPQLNSLRNNK